MDDTTVEAIAAAMSEAWGRSDPADCPVCIQAKGFIQEDHT